MLHFCYKAVRYRIAWYPNFDIRFFKTLLICQDLLLVANRLGMCFEGWRRDNVAHVCIWRREAVTLDIIVIGQCRNKTENIYLLHRSGIDQTMDVSIIHRRQRQQQQRQRSVVTGDDRLELPRVDLLNHRQQRTKRDVSPMRLLPSAIASLSFLLITSIKPSQFRTTIYMIITLLICRKLDQDIAFALLIFLILLLSSSFLVLVIAHQHLFFLCSTHRRLNYANIRNTIIAYGSISSTIFSSWSSYYCFRLSLFLYFIAAMFSLAIAQSSRNSLLIFALYGKKFWRIWWMRRVWYENQAASFRMECLLRPLLSTYIHLFFP